MATTVDLVEPLVFAPPTVRVYTAPTLSGDWTEQPYLNCDRIRETAGPGIDEAQLSYEVGSFSVRELSGFSGTAPDGEPTSLSALKTFCKVEFLDEDDEVLKTWYGVIEHDSLDPARKEDGTVSGTQRMIAFGLARLLEQTIIATSTIEDEYGEPMTIGRGLTFNLDEHGAIPIRGNRSEETTSASDGYIFSNVPRGSELWSGTDAVRYLLEYHAPKDADDEPICEWLLYITSTNVLDWYDISVATDRRSVKAVIDEICDRRRLCSYRVYGSEEGGSFLVYVEVFSFAHEDITLPGGDTLYANPNQIELNYIDSPLVQTNRLVRSQVHAVDRVIVEGEYVTTLATFDVNDLYEGWTSAQETEFLAGDDGGDDATANSAARSRDSMRDVFSRFVAIDQWDQTVTRMSDEETFFVTIPYDDLPDEFVDVEAVESAFRTEDGTAGEWWYRGKQFHRRLPIKDDETDDYRLPFVLFQEPDTDPAFYRYAEHLSAGGTRAFACSVHVLDDALGVRVRVNRAGAQQLIASENWGDAATTPSDEDPTVSTNAAVNYNTMLTTAVVDWDERVRYDKVLNVVSPGEHERIRRIRVSDARLDIELPGTVTDVAADGSLVESAGRAIRDDRPRLRELGDAAAQWYGVTRLAVDLAYGSSKPFVEVGQLVTSVDGEATNTVITEVVYDLRDSATSIATSFVEADFA